MRNPNSNCRGVPRAYVPDWKLARNGDRLDPRVTPPTTFGARSDPDPGTRDAPGKFPGRNAFAKLKTLKMLALGSTVTCSLILMGHDAFKSSDFSHGIPTAPGATEPSVGITQPRAVRSPWVITAGPDISPGHVKWLLEGTLLASRHAPAGVKLLA